MGFQILSCGDTTPWAVTRRDCAMAVVTALGVAQALGDYVTAYLTMAQNISH